MGQMFQRDVHLLPPSRSSGLVLAPSSVVFRRARDAQQNESDGKRLARNLIQSMKYINAARDETFTIAAFRTFRTRISCGRLATQRCLPC